MVTRKDINKEVYSPLIDRGIGDLIKISKGVAVVEFWNEETDESYIRELPVNQVHLVSHYEY